MSSNDDAAALVGWVMRTQVLLALIVAIPATLVGPGQGLFALIGGLFAVLLTAVFALRFFAADASQSAVAAQQALFGAAALKFVAAFVLFALAALFWPDYFLATVLGFVASTTSYFWALRFAP